MIKVQSLVFNDFLENTYILWDETKECLIIDPGCYYANESGDLKKFIEGKALKPILLLNTHCHIDHIFGNRFVKETFQVRFAAHEKEVAGLNGAVAIGKMYGIHLTPSPQPDDFLNEGDIIRFGNSSLDVLFTPGHSPGSISFYSFPDKFIIGGDVLFQGSIGRTDLPGGDYDTLMQSINDKILPLPDDVTVYNGHGSSTTIGAERKENPFVLEYAAERNKVHIR
ncbi:MAG: MBL fold metallo-hydrolase [Chitinophagales bacterium]|jgi:glyoxylase-like metal-dependent hydrolase (beta-lactamase superfamily II)|nr:MBL fold metallo-hydrolase [Chitinophagales bacterium]